MIFELQGIDRDGQATLVHARVVPLAVQGPGAAAAYAARPRAPRPVPRPRRPPRRFAAAQAHGPFCIKLAPDPGVFARIPVGAFREELSRVDSRWTSQPAGSSIDCCVQVYEVFPPYDPRSLAELELGDPELSTTYHPLKPAQAGVLGVGRPAGRASRLVFRFTVLPEPETPADHSAVDATTTSQT